MARAKQKLNLYEKHNVRIERMLYIPALSSESFTWGDTFADDFLFDLTGIDEKWVKLDCPFMIKFLPDLERGGVDEQDVLDHISNKGIKGFLVKAETPVLRRDDENPEVFSSSWGLSTYAWLHCESEAHIERTVIAWAERVHAEHLSRAPRGRPSFDDIEDGDHELRS